MTFRSQYKIIDFLHCTQYRKLTGLPWVLCKISNTKECTIHMSKDHWNCYRLNIRISMLVISILFSRIYNDIRFPRWDQRIGLILSLIDNLIMHVVFAVGCNEISGILLKMHCTSIESYLAPWYFHFHYKIMFSQAIRMIKILNNRRKLWLIWFPERLPLVRYPACSR